MLKYVVLALLWLGVSQAQKQAAEHDPSKPHETWGEQTRPITTHKHHPPSRLIGIRQAIETNGFSSQQVNVTNNGANIIGDAANEPSIAVNPLNPQQIVIGWRQFNSTNSSFREAGLAHSQDGGQTWHNIGPLEPGVFRSDPVLSVDADGVFFYQSLQVIDDNGQNGIQDDDTFRIDQWKSFDGGITWVDKTDVIGGDKSWYAIDPNDGPNRGNVYAAWNLVGNNHFPNSFNYSVDNGVSYSSPIEIPQQPIYGTVAVGHDGAVYVAGLKYVSGINVNWFDLNLIKSQGPDSVIFPDFNVQTPLNLGGAVRTGAINPEGLLGQIWVATDRSNRHTQGNVYVAASVDRFGSDPLDFNFIRSVDGGQSFSGPIRINTDGNAFAWQWFGTMGVAPNGRIDLVWLDTRNDSTAVGMPTESQLFYSYSYDGGISFSKNQAIGPAFNHALGYPVQRKMGDYIDIVSDDAGAHVAYAATYTGGQDVYYIHAKPAAFKENPYFPSHELDGLWHNENVPRQGIVSKTLVPDPNAEGLINFEAVFTETPDGTPTWFILENQHPATGSVMNFVVMYPTGDLSTGGTAVRPIGLASKARAFDEEGELIKNQLEYQFDMTEEALLAVADLTSASGLFDEAFYRQSPFFGIEKRMSLTPVVVLEAERATFCHPANLASENPLEKSEGRVPMAYQNGDTSVLFVADFTYEKTVDQDGQQSLVLNGQGLAIPTWQVASTTSGDVVADTATTNQVYQANGGNGFFNTSADDPGVTSLGLETYTLTGPFEYTSTTDDGQTETFNALAYNSFCGVTDPL